MNKKNVLYAFIGGIISLIFYLITYYQIYDFYLFSPDKSWITNPLFFLICGALIGYLLSLWKEKKLFKITISSFILFLLSILMSVYGTYAKRFCSLIFPTGRGYENISAASFECIFYIDLLAALWIISLLGLIFSFSSWVYKKLKAKKKTKNN